MKNKILGGLAVFAVVSMTMACKTRKAAVVAPPAKPVETLSNKRAETVNLLAGKDISYSTLSLRGKADLDINGDSHSVSLNLRIKKDQKIWASVTAFAGIEAARVLITPDSIFVLNRLQRTYLAKPFSYLQNFAGGPITFTVLQSMVSGNTDPAFLSEPAQLELRDGVWTTTGTWKAMSFSVLFNTLLKPKELQITDTRINNRLNVVYDQYQQVDQALFPSDLKLSAVSRGKKFDVALSFSKIERNVPVDFPFNVPKRFEGIK